MFLRVVAALLGPLAIPAITLAQAPSPTAAPSSSGAQRSFEPEPLPPLPPAPEATRPANAAEPPPPAAAPAGRIFCEQPVAIRLANPEAAAERYRPFIGIWSDASWTPQLCAALIVENVAPDGTATIVYVFGPMGPNAPGSAGVLQGTGIIRNGELRFQNSDRSQFAFRPLYADLDGRFTTPQGQTYQAIFKKTP